MKLKKLLTITFLMLSTFTLVTTVKAESYLSNQWVDGLGDPNLMDCTDVDGSAYTCQSGSPTGIDYHESYILYIPTDIMDDTDYIDMEFYDGYSLEDTVTFTTTTYTGTNGIISFAAIHDWGLVADKRIVINLYSIAEPTLSYTEADTSIEDYMLLYPTAFTYARIPTSVNYAEVYSEGYNDGQDDLFDNGSDLYGYTETDSYDYIVGQDDMFNNGSLLYGYLSTNAYDYIVGYNAGSQVSVNAGINNFNTGFQTWIVPAIIIVILLGGFTSIAVMKRNGG